MHRFWPKVIRPILEAAQPDSVVEVGAAAGAHTRRLAEYCRSHAVSLHVVDPAPRFEPSDLGDGVVFHKGLSLDVLADVGAVDVALIDGDHNWYTVNHELQLLQRMARSAGRPTPLAICHDVCWPYGRRDLYYDPATIPADYRHPWERAGVVQGRSALSRDRGLNAHLANAMHEGGPRNGVMTAIEDFVGTANEPLELTVLPVLQGLAILTPSSRLDANPRLKRTIARWGSAKGLADLVPLVEQERQRLQVASAELKRRRRSGRRPNKGQAVTASARKRRQFGSELPPEAPAGTPGGGRIGASPALARRPRSCAVFTIAQNESRFLPLWLSYYGRHFDPSDIYVLDHDSTDGSTDGLGDSCKVVTIHRSESFDHLWLKSTAEEFQSFLLRSYEAVLFAEVDEFVVGDPRRHGGLRTYIENIPGVAACCTGYNVVHYPEEPPLRFDDPVLRQRTYWHPSRLYSKRLLGRIPLAWSVGFHSETNAPAILPDPDLYLIHLHRVDYEYCLARHRAAASRDWNEHDLQVGRARHNRVVEPSEFREWFFHGYDLEGAEREIIPDHIKALL